MAKVIGHISQIIGPVVDVHFEHGEDVNSANLPSIHDALLIQRPNGKRLIVEVQQHIGEDTVRTIAMDSTDGLQRGMKVTATGRPITMPVGPQIRGRVMNVVGEAIDGMPELDGADSLPHPPRSAQVRRPDHHAGSALHGHQGHRPARALPERRKNRTVRRRRCGQDRAHQGAHQQHRQEAQRLLRVRRRGENAPAKATTCSAK